MNFKNLLTLTFVVTTTFWSVVSRAEEAPQIKTKPVAVSLGLFFPKDRDIKDAGTPLNLGFSYDLGSNGFSPFSYGVYLEGSQRKKDGNSFSLFGGGLQARYAFGDPTNSVRPFVRVGVGAYGMRYSPKTGSDVNGTRIGGLLAAGVDTQSGLFFEGGYRLVQSKDGINPSGWVVSVGYRF